MKKTLSILSYIPFVVILVVSFFIFSTRFYLPGGYRFYTVASGSMEPAISTGSLILIQKFASYNLKDIITFKAVGNKNSITHRVVKVGKKDKITYYEVKGDANNAPDPDLVPAGNVLGKVTFHIPFIGYAIAFFRTVPGLIIFVVIPATIIIYSELLNIKNEVVRLIKVRNTKKLNPVEKVEKAVGEEIVELEKKVKKITKKKSIKKKK